MERGSRWYVSQACDHRPPPPLHLPTCSITRSKDIKWEMERFGKVACVERDARERCAIVEFDR